MRRIGRCDSITTAVEHAPSTIHRIGQAFELEPHRVVAFAFDRPLFVEKVRDNCRAVHGLTRSTPLCLAWTKRDPMQAAEPWTGYCLGSAGRRCDRRST